MTQEFWGKKIGMTQLFVGDKVVPVTAIDVSFWVVTQLKTQERDGYNAIQIGLPRDRYAGQPFSDDWLKKSKKHFLFVKEVKVAEIPADLTVGKPADFYAQLTEGDSVNVTGITKGCGFAGAVRRHGFAGGAASHGSTMGKNPGSIGFMRSRGRVIKGKKLPGHMGVLQKMMRKLDVVKVERDRHIVLVKGSIPGKSGSLVFVKKA
ncbi:MAG: 50S ribosomal protein L3 [Candidatus Dependentiae bacterium]|nr:50S ribosomal protein L3 [Candidatus Dependentiae bacterium]